jgi:hypothetical protein
MGRPRNREDVNTIEEQSRRRDIATMVPQRNHGSPQNADDNHVIFSSITSYYVSLFELCNHTSHILLAW